MQISTSQNFQTGPAATLVVGGGIGGMRAALDLADAGIKVYLVEQTPGLGGRVSQLGFMFPQHDCVLCRGTSDHGYGCTRPSISPAYIQHNQHPNIEILTNTNILDVEGQAGDFSVSFRQEPRYVDIDRCTSCGKCTEVCPVELPNSYQLGMTKRKAAYKIAARATPDAFIIDKGPYCDDCGECVSICPTDAINLKEQPRMETVEVGAIILALGFKVYDADGLEELGHGRYPNVVEAMQYERLASRSGPTEGMITRPSDGKQPSSIAWLQCIGSRDQDNPFCSSICCMYATKEAILAKQRLGKDVDCSVFIMDERAFNKEYSAYFTKARDQYEIEYNYCRVSEIREDPQSGDLLVQFATPSGELHQKKFEMVVLATGLQPPESAKYLADNLGIELNQYGFCKTDKFTPLQTTREGVYVCGAFSAPKEISETIIEASGAAAEVMRLLNNRLHTHQYSREYPFLAGGTFPPERDVSTEEPRVGVFACTCGETISEVVDIPALLHNVSHIPNVVSVDMIEYACFPEVQDHLVEKIQQENINRVVIAACSNRTHESLFQRSIREAGLNPYLLEVVNLREQCSFVHQNQVPLANKKANELVRMAVGRVLVAKPVTKLRQECLPSALVIGGGLSGMTSALVIAESGYDVHLVERSQNLGGNLQSLYYVAEGFDPQSLLQDLIDRVQTQTRIHIHTQTEVINYSGHAGHFRTELRSKQNGHSDPLIIEHGVTIVATGAQETRQHALLDYPQAITQKDLEDKIIHQPEDIAALNDIVMIQCVQPEGSPDYCSRICCTNTIKNAIRVKQSNPSCNVTVLYKNMVTYGFREQYYTEARRLGVVFVRYTDAKPPEVILKGDQLYVQVYDLSLDRLLSLPADLIPMSMSISPSEGTQQLSQLLQVPLSNEGFFEEAQVKLRPMDFLREGIFLAGMAHYPKFIEESISHAMAAAGRAVNLLSQETLYLGGVIAVVDPDKCVGCLTCVRTCPLDIPRIISEENRSGVGGLGGAAFIDPVLCQGCGTCTGECPANAIQLIHYTDEQMMLREIAGLGTWMKIPVAGD
jgi:heterodisulfide reductase subunit A